MSEELKEGDEVVLRGKVTAISPLKRSAVLTIVREKSSQDIMVSLADLRKVRPGTYEVTARDVAKMICRAYRESNMFFWCVENWHGLPNAKDFKTLRRWVRSRLRELRRKRGGR